MLKLREFVLPIKGLVNERYQWSFQLNSDFFASFENSPIENAEVEAAVQLERRIGLMIFNIAISGYINCSCDRCTADIHLPLNRNFQLMVKLAWNENATDEDPDIVFIDPESPEFDLSVYLYEFACLSVPISKTYDCSEEEKPPCNFKVLDKLNIDQAEEEASESDNIWDQIRKELN